MNKHPRLLKEAADTLTPPARLAALAKHKVEEVARVASLNASLPAEAWRERLLAGMPEAWDNPQAAVELLGGWSGEGGLSKGARFAAVALLKEPERCSAEGRFWLDTILRRWWQDENDAEDMVFWLERMANVSGIGSPRHRQLVLLLLQCVSDQPVNEKSKQALELVGSWARGGEDNRTKAFRLADNENKRASKKLKDASDLRYNQNVYRPISAESRSAKCVYFVAGASLLSSNRYAAVAMSYAATWYADIFADEHSEEWDYEKSQRLAWLADLIRKEIKEPWLI